ncbi:unnamed protein product [Didymodactylos carnosus]|uniref:Uncharacterized protein n=1 Tax=Didymodactylos carnosus TaxID=1234261 RepID=A0A816DSJ4_9BILA|nr:unnamed protein product [Didymodactylos carnosus]CAF4556918.1 unnamed protein product [Didymodactylos carnosus]
MLESNNYDVNKTVEAFQSEKNSKTSTTTKPSPKSRIISSSLSTAVLTSTSKPTGERNKQLSAVIDQTNELRIITSASRSMYDQIQAQIEENEPKMAACSNEKLLDYYIS